VSPPFFDLNVTLTSQPPKRRVMTETIRTLSTEVDFTTPSGREGVSPDSTSRS